MIAEVTLSIAQANAGVIRRFFAGLLQSQPGKVAGQAGTLRQHATAVRP